MIKIEVAFATPELQKIIALEISEETTLHEAIQQSGIQDYYPDHDISSCAIGVFGKRIYNLNEYKIKSGDRVEIYRPLAKTPNQKRLERVKNK